MEQHAGNSTPHDSARADGSLPQSLRIHFGAGAMGMAVILNTMGGVLVCDRPVAGKRSGRSRNHGLGIFAAGILVMGPALLPDAVEYDYLKTGMRREGTLSSFYSTVEKLAFAVGPALALYFLS